MNDKIGGYINDSLKGFKVKKKTTFFNININLNQVLWFGMEVKIFRIIFFYRSLSSVIAFLY